MAGVVLRNAYVCMGIGSASSFEITSYVKSVEIDYGSDLQDNTSMGSNTKTSIAGLLDWGVKLELLNDYASGTVDSFFFTYVGSTADLRIAVRPTTSALGVNNPEYYGAVAIEKYPPIAGSVGNVATASINLKAASSMGRRTA